MQSEQFQLHAQIEDRHWWFVARRRILRELVHKVAPPSVCALNETQKRTIVVDIGCGTGANLAALADDYRCVGIDTSAEAVALARRRFPGITFICGSAPQDVAHWLRQAAVVLLTDVLEHVEKDRELLASIVRACPPGTQILITVPADMRLWSPHDEAFGHFRRYDAETFAAVLADLPVIPRLVSYFNSRLYPLVRGTRLINRLRGRSSGEANTDFKLPSRPTNSVLEACFAGERRRLLRAVDSDGRGYRHGVSLVAILEREPESKRNATIQRGIIAHDGIGSENQSDFAASINSTPAAL
jgi:SAM-dependent methyltransferase